jgi:hypothetical protein
MRWAANVAGIGRRGILIGLWCGHEKAKEEKADIKDSNKINFRDIRVKWNI